MSDLLSIEEAMKWLKENKQKLLQEADEGKKSALFVIKSFQIYATVASSGEDVSGPPTLGLVNAIQDYLDEGKPHKKINKWQRKIKREHQRKVQKNLTKIQKMDDDINLN